ncbi:MAG TPA: T9SS type A sorting domain-containing protein [Bacteroidetes bacterium]|nr:T9SS type A sorting domain-containing protein [Bacteroidota bacterium]
MTKPILACFFAVCFFSSLGAQSFDIYISDAGNFNNPPWQILKFDQNGENGEVFISDHVSWPQDIFFIENENTVLVTNLSSVTDGRISKYNATTGEFIEEFATGIGGPTRMKLGADGLLYVLQWKGNGKVLRYNLDGSLEDEFTETGVNESIGIDWDADGNLYVSSYGGGFVRKFSPTGEDLGNFISSNLAGPTNIWFGENGDLYVVDYNGSSVKRFDGNGNFIEVLISGLPQGEGVGILPNGNIVIGSGGTSSVRVYDSAGAFIKDLVPSGTLGLITPNAVVFRESSTLSASEVYKEITFVRPTVGERFQIEKTGGLKEATSFEVFNSAGEFIEKINFADSTVWNASALADGVYFVVVKLPDGAVARQKVVVQKKN